MDASTRWMLRASACALVVSSASGCSTQTIQPTQHRANAAQCMTSPPPGNCPCGEGGDCSEPGLACTRDASCVDAGVNGRCVESVGPPSCWCTFDACLHDSDCPTGQTCACHGSPYTYSLGNACVPSNCRVDADCGPGGFCSPSVASQCGPNLDLCLGYYCHTSRDQCTNDADCDVAQACIYSYSAGFWKCTEYIPPS